MIFNMSTYLEMKKFLFNTDGSDAHTASFPALPYPNFWPYPDPGVGPQAFPLESAGAMYGPAKMFVGSPQQQQQQTMAAFSDNWHANLFHHQSLEHLRQRARQHESQLKAAFPSY